MPRTGPDTRPLHLKFRVVVTKRMRMRTMQKLLQRAVSTGIVPAGIEIRWIDWSKGHEGRANEGRLPEPVHDDLQVWYGALFAPQSQVKYALVDRGGEE
jgi:hypothetical protein